MLNWLEVLSVSPPLLVVAIVLMFATFLIGRLESWRLLKAYGKQEDGTIPPLPDLVQYMRVLPYLVLSFSHFALRKFQTLLTYGFFLTLIAAFTLPLTFDAIAAKVYALNGIGTLYTQGDIRPEILAFQHSFMLVSLALAGSLIAWVLGVVMAPRVKFRWVISTLGFIGLMASLGWSAQVVLPFLKENGPALLNASTRAGNQFSVLSQFILAPVYALVLVAMMAVVLVPSYIFTVLIVAFWTAFIRRKGEETTPFFELVNEWIRKVTFSAGMWVGAGAAISFALTIVALMLGEFSMHETGMQRLVITPQLLFVNAITDGLTLTLTVWTIGYGVKLTKGDLVKFLIAVGMKNVQKNTEAASENKKKKAKQDAWMNSVNIIYVLLIAAVITIDLVFAGIFAVTSLYYGLLGGGWQVSIAEALHILFGLNQSGSAIQLSERFWVMHTTFLPTLLYMGFVVVALVLMVFWNKYLAGLIEAMPPLVRKLVGFIINVCAPAYVLALGTQYVPDISSEQYITFVREGVLHPLLDFLKFFALA
jgi:hypothetical protein